MVVSIHQPYYFPWMGYFDKIRRSDVFVFLDDAQYEKNNFYNRNRLRAKTGTIMITVPVTHDSTATIDDTRIVSRSSWQDKHYKSFLYNYSGAKNWKMHQPFLDHIFNKTKWMWLCDLNMATVEYVARALDINRRIELSSKMEIKTTGTQRLVDICRTLGATKYYSGASGKNYMDMNLFENAGIDVEFQNYKQEPYRQAYDGYEPNCSAMDFVLNNCP